MSPSVSNEAQLPSSASPENGGEEAQATRTRTSSDRHRRLAQRLRAAVWAAPRGLHVVLLCICLALGLALATQVRTQRSDPLESLSQEDLVVILDELSTQEQSLRAQRAQLRTQLADLEDENVKEQAAREAAKKTVLQSKINSGEVAVSGPGVVLSVYDPAHALSATHFVMTLGELRNAGAEAIELNGVRLTMSSSFLSDASGVSVDGKLLESPYVWSIVGDSQTIATALEIQAGSAAQMRAKGASVGITQQQKVTIESTAAPRVPQFARPS